MELLQNLLMDITRSLRRQELEDQANPDQSNAAQHAEKARRTVNRITMAANRSVWCSVCNLQTFIKTGAMCRKSHFPISVFLSRQSFLMHQCKRLLSKQDDIVIQTASVPQDEWLPLTTLHAHKQRNDAAIAEQHDSQSIQELEHELEAALNKICLACGKSIDGTPVQQNNVFPLHFGCIDASLPWRRMDSEDLGIAEQHASQSIEQLATSSTEEAQPTSQDLSLIHI